MKIYYYIEIKQDINYRINFAGAFAKLKGDLPETMNKLAKTAADMSIIYDGMGKMALKCRYSAS